MLEIYNHLELIADVRDGKAYYMLVTKNPIGGEYYNIGGEYTCEIGEMLDYLISQSTTDNITIEVDKDRLRPIDQIYKYQILQSLENIQVGNQNTLSNKL